MAVLAALTADADVLREKEAELAAKKEAADDEDDVGGTGTLRNEVNAMRLQLNALTQLMHRHFDGVCIYKPAQSRPANSERSARVPYPQSTEPNVGSVPWVVR